MDFQKALNILGLNPYFTEAELKQAWRRLSHKNHPDNPRNIQNQDEEEATRKQAEINAAYEFLKNNSKNGKSNYNRYNQYQNAQNETTFNTYEYIMQKKLILNNVVSFNFNKYKVSDKIKEIIDIIRSQVYRFIKLAALTNNKQDADNIFNECFEKIKKYFKELKDEFYKENNIDENDVKENLNYDCTLTEFYENLLKIKEKYSKEEKVKND